MGKIDELRLLSARQRLRKAPKCTPEHAQAMRNYLDAVRRAHEADREFDGLPKDSPKTLYKAILIEAICETVREGAQSCKDVAEMLTARGILNFYGRPYAHHTINTIVWKARKEERYCLLRELNWLCNHAAPCDYDRERIKLRDKILRYIKQGLARGDKYDDIVSRLDKAGIRRRDGGKLKFMDVANYVYRYRLKKTTHETGRA